MWKRNPDGRKSMVKTKRLVRTSMELIRLAYDDKIDEIQKFVDEHVEDCWKMQLINLNVLLFALLRKQFVAFAVLQTNGFELPYENRGETKRFEKLTENELTVLQQEIRKRYVLADIYLEFETDISPLVRKLMQKTKLASTRSYMEKFDILRQNYVELERMEDVRPLLVIIADSEPLEIVCSFWHRSIGYTLPGKPFASGFCNIFEGIILLKSHREMNAVATTVHEFIHYIMYVLYDNRGFPFLSTDSNREEAYHKAYEACEAISKLDSHKDLEYLLYFSYEEDNTTIEELEYIRRTEAITLPAIVSVEFRAETVMKYEQAFTPLFDFYKTQTLPDIVKRSQEIEVRLEDKKSKL